MDSGYVQVTVELSNKAFKKCNQYGLQPYPDDIRQKMSMQLLMRLCLHAAAQGNQTFYSTADICQCYITR